MLFTDVQNLVKMLIKWIFLSGHAHPGKYQASATADNVHFPFMFADLLNGLSGNSAVQGYKIHTIFRMQTHHIDKILGS